MAAPTPRDFVAGPWRTACYDRCKPSTRGTARPARGRSSSTGRPGSGCVVRTVGRRTDGASGDAGRGQARRRRARTARIRPDPDRGNPAYRVYTAMPGPTAACEALALINQILDEVLAEQEGDFDADSRWALAWFEQHGFDEGGYGVAETLSTAKNTSVAGMEEAGILKSRAGQVRLLRPRELPADWDPESDARRTVWETVHHLVRVLETGGEQAAAALVRKLSDRGEAARELCYRLYTLCERKKRPAEALAYNGLVQSWPEISRLAAAAPAEQGELLEEPPEAAS